MSPPVRQPAKKKPDIFDMGFLEDLPVDTASSFSSFITRSADLNADFSITRTSCEELTTAISTEREDNSHISITQPISSTSSLLTAIDSSYCLPSTTASPPSLSSLTFSETLSDINDLTIDYLMIKDFLTEDVNDLGDGADRRQPEDVV